MNHTTPRTTPRPRRVARPLAVGALLLAPPAATGLTAWWLIHALLLDNRPSPSATMVG